MVCRLVFVGGAALLALIVGLPGASIVFADGSTGATTTDAYAKERTAEFQEIAKEKKRTYKGIDRQFEILRELERAPCNTAERFLLGLIAKRSTAGDHRLYALRAVLRMADDKALAKVLTALQKAKDPTLWAFFGETLLDQPSDAVSAWVHGPALDSKPPEVLCACLDALARKPDAALTGRIAELFAAHAGEAKGSVDVAYCALKVLARAGPEASKAPLLEAARHADWRLRLAAADGLPALEPFDADVEAAVRGLLQDASPQVERAAITSTGTHKRVALADLLVAKLSSDVARTRHVAAVALAALSGKAYGHDAQAWAAWLAKQDPGAPVDVAFPRYHGVEIHSGHVVFVVDASSSMTWPWRKERHRIDIALAELQRTLDELDPATVFNVLVFAEKRDTWKKTGLPASKANTASAAAWAAKAMAKPAGDTFLYEALEEALEDHETCDTIFLLTDGNPTAGTYWTPEGLVASVRAWTRYRRTAIHTVGLSLLNMDRGMPNLTEKPALMKRVLSGIAAATSGQYTEILNEPK